MYMSVLAKRISGYMVENSYIDTSIQMAGIPGFSGCIEYTSVISQLIKEVKKDKKNFAVWLDLANAHRSVLHHRVTIYQRRSRGLSGATLEG